MSVLIVGAGIGGLTAALALARIGVQSIIVERAPELAAIGAGVQLSPNATRVLRTLGVLDALSATASRPNAIRVRTARGGQTLALMTLDHAERRWGAPYLVVRRADLQRVLADAVAANADISLCLGTALAGFASTERGVQATLKQGLLTRTVAAEALIGADGVRSVVRARLAGDAVDAPQDTGRVAWRALIDAAGLAMASNTRETGLWLGRNAHLVHYALDDGRLINVIAVTRDTAADPETSWSQPGEPAVIRTRFAAWHRTARDLIAAAATWTVWPLYDRAPLAAWNAGPIALLGDAAHPILPFLAQGAAQAIEDAGALAHAFGRTRDAVEALNLYSLSRLARATRVQETSRQLGRIYHLSGPAALARDTVMRLAGGRRLLHRYDWLYGL